MHIRFNENLLLLHSLSSPCVAHGYKSCSITKEKRESVTIESGDFPSPTNVLKVPWFSHIFFSCFYYIIQLHFLMLAVINYLIIFA
jgi:hypothetical protein